MTHHSLKELEAGAIEHRDPIEFLFQRREERRFLLFLLLDRFTCHQLVSERREKEESGREYLTRRKGPRNETLAHPHPQRRRPRRREAHATCSLSYVKLFGLIGRCNDRPTPPLTTSHSER